MFPRISKIRINSSIFSGRFSFQTLHTFLRCFGLIPTNLKLKFSFLNYLYSLCLLSITAFVSIIGFYKMINVTIVWGPIKFFNTASLLGIVTVGSWVIIINSILRCNIYEKACKKFLNTDNLFENFSIEFSDRFLYKKNLITVSIFIFVPLLTDFLCFRMRGITNMLVPYLSSVHLPFIFINMNESRMINIFELLTARFAKFNQFFAVPQEQVYNCTLVSNCHRSCKFEIRNLSQIRKNLIIATNAFNSYFSPMLLTQIVVYFVIFICQTHAFVILLWTRKHISKEKWMVLYLIFWITSVAFRLIRLVRMSVLLMEEVTVFILSDLSLKNIFICNLFFR